LWLVTFGLPLATAAGLFVRAKLGFGFSLVVVPLASLIVGFGPAVLFAIVLEVVSSSSMAWILRKDLRLLDAGLLKVGALIGILCAWLLSGYIKEHIATVVGMSVVIATCIYIILVGDVKRAAPPTGFILPGLGMLSGLLNYWTSLSGPPVVLAYARSDMEPTKIVATLTGYFSLLYAYTFFVEIITGRYDHFRYWMIAVVCSVGTVLLMRPIRRLVDRIDIDFHRSAVFAVAVSAFVVLIRALLSH
jgi:uncharacterized membrane protein YfcA